LRSGISRAERQDLAAVLVRLQNNVAVAVHGTPDNPPTIDHSINNPPINEPSINKTSIKKEQP
jgi:hypothetical protein